MTGGGFLFSEEVLMVGFFLGEYENFLAIILNIINFFEF